MNLLCGSNLKNQKNDGLREPPDQVVCKQSASMSPSAYVFIEAMIPQLIYGKINSIIDC